MPLTIWAIRQRSIMEISDRAHTLTQACALVGASRTRSWEIMDLSESDSDISERAYSDPERLQR